MKEKFRSLLHKRIESDWFKALSSSAMSALINIAFTLYNMIFGIVKRSMWHGTIGVYYLLLAGVRTMIVMSQKQTLTGGEKSSEQMHRRTYIITHIILLLMNISLIVPITVMVRGEREYTLGLTPAIISAAYTTYRLTSSIVGYRHSKKADDILITEQSVINMIDSLTAVLTLQNTLLMANGGVSGNMKTLCAWTSGGILLVIVLLTIVSFLRLRKRN